MFGITNKKDNSTLGILNDEHYKITSNNILVYLKEEGMKSVMVTSPSLIHRKSQITSKIATTFAEMGKMTLLVDMNVKEPSIHRLFSVDNNLGLTSLLLDKDSMISPICKTMYENLHVLPSGSGSLTKSIVWDQLDDLMKDWKEHYDYLIFELPPYLGFSDTQIITEKGDGILLVIQEGLTQKKAALETKKLLERGSKKLMGAIYCS